MELQIKDKVKFRSVSENLVKIGLIKNITHKLNNPNNKYEILTDDGELYLNVHEDDIISFLGFGPSYMADECENKEAPTYLEIDDRFAEPRTIIQNSAGVEYHIGDCVYLEHKSDEEIKGDFIITYILGNRIELLSLTGIHYFVYKENVKITANIGSIFIPGVGYSQTVLLNKGKIDTDAFMYRLGDIVTVKATKRVGKIADAYFSSSNGCVAYKIDYFDSNEDEYIVWQPYTNIVPGDYRMKEHEEAKSEINCTVEWDEESGCSVHGRCDKCPATNILNQDSLAGLRSHDEICEIRFCKPLVSIFYNNGGESTVELSNAYNKKVGFLLAYIQGLVSTEEYDAVINIIQSINKEPQQIITFDETCNEDD